MMGNGEVLGANLQDTMSEWWPCGSLWLVVTGNV
jgi:hypothetical protein